jgi:8-amino-7-oxononanoate synthase
MDGDIAPLNELTSIAQQHNAELVIDDAHGFGVLGKTGAGSCEHFALTAEQAPVYMATLGKAAGCYGAFVAGSETLIETLINQARNYIFTTATPPALAEAARESLNIIQSESWRRDKLNDNIQFFKNLSQQKGLETIASDTAIQPIIIGDNERLLYIKQQLFEKGFLIGAIRPPTVPKGTARIRITLTAEHEQKDIQVLLDLLEQFR